jgi:hypothetical protein
MLLCLLFAAVLMSAAEFFTPTSEAPNADA